LRYKYDIPAIRQVQRQERDFEEIGAFNPQQRQDIPRVMEIAKRFRPVFLPPPGARVWHWRGGKKLLYLRRSPSPSAPGRPLNHFTLRARQWPAHNA
jgi:hypothetical protein